MRKTTFAAVAVLATALSWGYSQAASETFKGSLTNAAEVPPTTGSGSGTATVTLDTATKMITYNVTYSGLTGPAAAAHIHCGAAAGANSGVAVPFPKPESPIAGTATMTDAQVADLHTAANKGGEIRAQLTK
jgi:CHRD domain